MIGFSTYSVNFFTNQSVSSGGEWVKKLFSGEMNSFRGIKIFLRFLFSKTGIRDITIVIVKKEKKKKNSFSDLDRNRIRFV